MIHRNDLMGTSTMVRLVLRRDRVRFPVWVLGIVAAVAGSAGSVQNVYATATERAQYAETIGNSAASIAMAGPAVGLESMGGLTVFETSSTALVATALMAIFLTVRHTRGEEEAGRAELLRSAEVGRLAAPAATIAYVSAASLLVGLSVAVCFVALGLPANGSWLFGVSIAATGLVFAAVAVTAAQVTEHARAAVGGSAAVLAVAFALRAIGDVSTPWLSWLSPIGWSQGTHPYAGDRWWPLLLSVAAAGVLLTVATVLVGRRDLGAGLVVPRLGAETASPRLASAWALTARLQRTSFVSWTIGMLLGGMALGSVTSDVEGLVDDRPDLRDAIAPDGGDITAAYVATAMLILALVAAGYTVSSVLRMRGEETSGRLEALLATGLARVRWASGTIAFSLATTAVVLLAGGVGLGVASAVGVDDTGLIGDAVGGAAAYVPAAFVVAAVTVALVGWAPGAVGLAWAVVAGCFTVGYLGQLLAFPDWLRDLSPYTHVPQVGVETVDATALVTLTALAAIVTLLGVDGLRRRDIG